MNNEVMRTMIHTDTGRDVELIYCVTESVTEIEGVKHSRFGILISDGSEACCAADISGSRDDAMALVEKLCGGLVTPTTLEDIVSDWLLETEFM